MPLEEDVSAYVADTGSLGKKAGFDIVFPPGYQGGPASVPPGYSCAIGSSGEGGFASDFACQWGGTGTLTPNVAVKFYLNNALAAADSGKVMACYGSSEQGWRSPPPPSCFFLTGP